MEAFSLEELKSFIGAGPVCISLFLPIQRGGIDAFQNPVRLRNLLTQAKQELEKRDYDEAAIEALLQPGHSLVEDVSFWEHPRDGLALFLAPGLLRPYRLPLAFKERVEVGPRFLIRPLLPLLSGDGRFCVLALSQNAVRLLEGTRDSLREVALEGVPKSLAEALQYDEAQTHQNVQYNAGLPFPGNTEPKEDRKEKIARYFHLVGKALPESIKNGSVPLVLAGVEYETAIYRQITTCPHLVAEGIPGNPERLKPEALHARAWQLVQPYFQEAQRQAIVQYTERVGTGLASDDIREIVPAACSGRVAFLLAGEEPLLYGRFDPTTNRVEMRPEAQAGNEDLVNLAIIETLLHGGTLYADTAKPEDHARPLAAVFRY
jgi:hypothetical protein